MLRKFVEGLVFGTGFAIAFLAVAGIAGFLFVSTMLNSDDPMKAYGGWDSGVSDFSEEPGPPFHELSIGNRSTDPASSPWHALSRRPTVR